MEGVIQTGLFTFNPDFWISEWPSTIDTLSPEEQSPSISPSAEMSTAIDPTWTWNWEAPGDPVRNFSSIQLSVNDILTAHLFHIGVQFE
jgi:hypothetical protein